MVSGSLPEKELSTAAAQTELPSVVAVT